LAKPFSIQAPEDVAKEYGGNKQAIAQAAQMGIVDPTAAVLAGMFIDRMRAAQVLEGAQQPTVAQQVLGGGGLPTPPANPMAPGMGAPAPQPAPAMQAPMGAPMGAPPMQAPMGAPPAPMPGMAMGGIASLPVPGAMFDEPDNGGYGDGYSGGGLVAFADAGSVYADSETNRRDEEEEEAATGDIVASNRKVPTPTTQVLPGMMFNAPENILGGLKEKVTNLFDFGQELNPYRTERAQELEAMLEQARSPEAREKRKKEDMYMALAQLGATMASTPGSLLQAASAGIREALPGAAAAAKERRGEERAITKELLAEERMSNKERTDRFNMTLDLVVKGVIPLEEAYQDRNFRDKWEKLGNETQERVARINAAAGITQAGISARASMYGSDRELQARRGAYFDNAYTELKKTAPFDPQYQALAAKNPTAADLYIRRLAEQETNRVYGGGSTGANSGSGNDPVGIR
jgi:hypothetical protein